MCNDWMNAFVQKKLKREKVVNNLGQLSLRITKSLFVGFVICRHKKNYENRETGWVRIW